MPSIYRWHCTLCTGVFFGIIRVSQRIQFTTSLPSAFRQNKLICGVCVSVCVCVCVCALHTATCRIICYSHPKTHNLWIWKLVSLNALHFLAKHHLCAIFLRNTISKLTFSTTDNNNNNNNNNNRLCLILKKRTSLTNVTCANRAFFCTSHVLTPWKE